MPAPPVKKPGYRPKNSVAAAPASSEAVEGMGPVPVMYHNSMMTMIIIA